MRLLLRWAQWRLGLLQLLLLTLTQLPLLRRVRVLMWRRQRLPPVLLGRMALRLVLVLVLVRCGRPPLLLLGRVLGTLPLLLLLLLGLGGLPLLGPGRLLPLLRWRPHRPRTRTGWWAAPAARSAAAASARRGAATPLAPAPRAATAATASTQHVLLQCRHHTRLAGLWILRRRCAAAGAASGLAHAEGKAS